MPGDLLQPDHRQVALRCDAGGVVGEGWPGGSMSTSSSSAILMYSRSGRLVSVAPYRLRVMVSFSAGPPAAHCFFPEMKSRSTSGVFLSKSVKIQAKVLAPRMGLPPKRMTLLSPSREAERARTI